MTSTEPPKVSKDEAVRAVYGYAASLMNLGKSKWQIEDALIAKGISKEAAVVIVENLSKARDKAYRNSARSGALRQMAIGGVICLVGIVVTVGTYTAASSSSSGGSYVVAWGAIVFGALRFFRGLSHLNG